MSSSTRYDLMKKVYGEEKFARISSAKVLIVGAGGIGCEILKNLALTGFQNVELIDLDTIDVSNLNRQFLFRPQHVGQPKAHIAAAAARQFNPHFQCTAYHANIKDTQFDSSYFSKFDAVLNALDNVDARRHVNRLCLAVNVPLFDSGTTGYLGQVMPIMKGITACYECFPKPTQKVYPICTIRSTPDKPVHCIVWAKEALKLLFGRASDSMLYEDKSALADKTISVYMHCLELPFVAYQDGTKVASETEREALLSHVRALLVALFVEDVQQRIEMGVYSTAKTVPAPLALSLLDAGIERARCVLRDDPSLAQTHSRSGAQWEQTVWSVEDCVCETVYAFHSVIADNSIHTETHTETHTQHPPERCFDKDDEWSMRLVAAMSNLRASVFHIPTLSFHDAKGVAGNIIPAIATTNAIIAAAQCAQMVKFITEFSKEKYLSVVGQKSNTTTTSGEGQGLSLREKMSRFVSSVYCLRFPTRKGLHLQPCSPDPPVQACYVCGKAQVTVQIDTHSTTLADLVQKILKELLGFHEPTISCGANLLYEEGEGCDEDLQDNLPLTLSTLPGGGVQHESVLSVSDFTQELSVDVCVRHVGRDVWDAIIPKHVTEPFLVNGPDALDLHKQAQSSAQSAAEVAEKALADELETTAEKEKRPLEEETLPNKKQRSE